MRARLSVVLILILASACSASKVEETTEPERDASGSRLDAGDPRDAAFQRLDAGTHVGDAAVTGPDASESARDAAPDPLDATPVEDGGNGLTDAGSTVPDAATTLPDAGGDEMDAAVMVPDAGDTASDAAVAVPDAGVAVCQVTVCLTGAVAHGDGSNDGFRRLCERPEVRGRVDNCNRTPCESTWTNFPSTSVSTQTDSYVALFTALDSNRDGRVDGADAPCQLNLLGFSWGGVNLSRLAKTFLTDARVDASRRSVERFIAMDPYQPLTGGITIPPGVVHAWVYRHSVAPEQDCSSGVPVGPYKGVPPRCAAGQDCTDHDYSLNPTTVFRGGGLTLRGDQIGHCDVPYIATPAVVANLLDQVHSQLPDTHPVEAP